MAFRTISCLLFSKSLLEGDLRLLYLEVIIRPRTAPEYDLSSSSILTIFLLMLFEPTTGAGERLHPRRRLVRRAHFRPTKIFRRIQDRCPFCNQQKISWLIPEIKGNLYSESNRKCAIADLLKQNSRSLFGIRLRGLQSGDGEGDHGIGDGGCLREGIWKGTYSFSILRIL